MTCDHSKSENFNEWGKCRECGIREEDVCLRCEELTAESKVMREALEKLARLGNEPHLGNSDGNVIAQRALAAVSSQQGPSDG